MRPWERRGVGAEGGESVGREDTDTNTNTTASSANASTSSSTAASGSSGARRNGAAAAAGEGWGRSSLSTATINLSQEYTLAIHTSSYHEIWAKIHVDGGDGQREGGVSGGGGGEEDEEDEDRCTLAGVLQPEDAVVERALGDAPDTELTRLAADYLRSTHHASLLCLSLRRALRRARALYGPITDLLALIPHAPPLAAPHRDCAFDAFLLFDQMPNPFPGPRGRLPGHAPELRRPQEPPRPAPPQGPPQAPAVDPADYIQYDEADVASEEAVWALYERWRDFYGAERSHDEMLRRFGMFKDKARHVLEFNKSGASFTKALKEGADLTLEENAKRLGIRRRL
ncbi:hypothetical protein OsJ_14694 [Oryza sativa Japonica Group]|uniref:Cathepsin propeptide inhibitor domain-containing protein n=1 Tax=Oryza sativa subsp. japonica TaxID=39947 RepID=B9FF10_ORYSJ|nr:hypothetical protein OsJ_14694 [Oryza sativa Japonica Group]